jgi:fructokinase
MILVCGEALMDVFAGVAPNMGPLPMEAHAGGSPFNVALGLARLGAPSALFTGLSTDALGETLHGVLVREGVSTAPLVRSARPTTLSLVALDAGGAASYVFYGDGAADISLTAADLPAPDDSVEALHFGSYSIAVPPTADAFLALARRERGRFISLDPNVRLNVEPSLDIWRGRVADMLELATLVKASAEDLAMLHPGVAHGEIARDWRGRGPALVVITKGEAGSTAYFGATSLEVPAVPTEVIDTIGAGDSFQAALLDGLRRGGLLSRAALEAVNGDALRPILVRAARAAAIACGRKGADLPRAAEIS